MSENNESNQEDTLNLVFENKQDLFAAYMPFVKQGGLFIRTNRSYANGTTINLSVQLPGDTATYQIQGQVVWVTPVGAQGGVPAGIGVQFEESKSMELVKQIQTLIVGMEQMDIARDTM